MNSKVSFQDRLRDVFTGGERKKKEPPVIPPLRVMLNDLLTVPDMDWGMYAFRREPLRGRFRETEKENLIQKANACGMEHAIRIKEHFKGCNVYEIAKQLGLKVDYPDMPNGGGHILFAQFVEPDQVTVYRDSTKRADQLIDEYKLQNLFKHVTVEEILLAHEIFHFIEEQEEKTIFTRTETIKLWKIGPLHNTSKIVCLGEIAGMAFAKELLALEFSPYLLDSFLVYSYNREVAYYLYEEIMNIHNKRLEI